MPMTTTEEITHLNANGGGNDESYLRTTIECITAKNNDDGSETSYQTSDRNNADPEIRFAADSFHTQYAKVILFV